MINIDLSILSLISATFKTNKPNKVKTKPCRIQFQGEFITTASNKTVWRNIGFAKSALLNHFESSEIVNTILKAQLQKSPQKQDIKNLIKQLENAGFIKYVEVEIENYATEKK